MVKKILLGLFIYLCFMLVFLPAKVVYDFLPIPEQITINHINGTIWHGTAQTLNIDNHQLEQIQWDFRPSQLLLGKIVFALKIGDRTSEVKGDGRLSYSLAGFSISDLKLTLPSAFLLADRPLPMNTQVLGDIKLDIINFSQGLPWCDSLSGRLIVNKLNVANAFGDFPLGNIELGLGCDEGKLSVDAQPKNNQLGFSGNLTLAEGGKFLLKGKIKETDSQPKSLRQALIFLGRPDKQGYYSIRYSGAIP